jgi:hypothetical protein
VRRAPKEGLAGCASSWTILCAIEPVGAFDDSFWPYEIGKRVDIFPAASGPQVAAIRHDAQSTMRRFNRFLGFNDSDDHPAAISLGDVNGDGDFDVVLSTGRHSESPIHLYVGDGKGGFRPCGDIGNQGYASYGARLVDLKGMATSISWSEPMPAEPSPYSSLMAKGCFRLARFRGAPVRSPVR